jgi:hypothetical protein
MPVGYLRLNNPQNEAKLSYYGAFWDLTNPVTALLDPGKNLQTLDPYHWQVRGGPFMGHGGAGRNFNDNPTLGSTLGWVIPGIPMYHVGVNALRWYSKNVTIPISGYATDAAMSYGNSVWQGSVDEGRAAKWLWNKIF